MKNKEQKGKHVMPQGHKALRPRCFEASHNFTKHQTSFNASVQFISEAHRSTESPWCLVVIAKLGALCRRWFLFGCRLLRLAKETEFKSDCLRQSGPLWPVVAVVGIARSACP